MSEENKEEITAEAEASTAMAEDAEKKPAAKVRKPFPFWDYVPFTVVFAGIWMFLFWKCKFGFANIDESFYLTIPYRLCQGDSLFLNEWHLSQTSSILLMPLVKLYLMINGDMTGALLCFRYIFTAVWGLAAYFYYYRLKTFSRIGAAAASLIFMIYAPFGIMALSYNSLGILMVLTAGVFLLTSKTHLRIQYSVAGLFLAGAVLCCPYLAGMYAVYSAVILAMFVYTKYTNRKASEKAECKAASAWLWVTVGCAALAVVFGLFVISRASISKIIDAFPTIMDDPEHPPLSLKDKNQAFWSSITTSYIHAAFYLNLSFILFYIAKTHKQLRFICLMIVGLTVAGYTNYFVKENIYLNFVMFPINILGLYCGLSSENKLVRRILYLIWIPGMMYAYCINMSSNQYFYCISSASTVSSAASALMAVMYAAEIMPKKEDAAKTAQKIARFVPVAAVTVFLTFQIVSEVKVRYKSIFWESGDISLKDTKITEGPEKGIMVEKASADYFKYSYDIIKPIFDGEYGSKVLYLSQSTWMYLCGDNIENCAFSAWLSGITEQSVGRLIKYYELNPDKVPDVIYIEYYDDAIAAPFYDIGFIRSSTSTNASILVKI